MKCPVCITTNGGLNVPFGFSNLALSDESSATRRVTRPIWRSWVGGHPVLAPLCVCIYIYIYIYVHIQVHVYVCLCAYLYICICVYIGFHMTDEKNKKQ